MKTTKELLELMLANINLMGDFGLCALISELYWSKKISLEEYFAMSLYIKKYRPNNLRTHFNTRFYWIIGRKYPRIKWLKKQIKYNK
jgi:hypothetical protein